MAGSAIANSLPWQAMGAWQAAAPGGHGDTVTGIQYLALGRLQPMLGHHVFWRLFWHAGKDWPAVGQAHPRRARQEERVITIEKQAEAFRAADDADATVGRPERIEGFFE